MPETIETTVYQFDELSESAKDAARNWWKSASADDDWYEYTYEDVKECGALIGITVDRIYFSGFSSQGDGACFEGSYAYKKGASAAIAAHTGGCDKLQNIAAALQETQRKAFYRLTAKVKHNGRYMHENCTDIDTYNGMTGDYATNEQCDEIAASLRDFMRWTYRELERAYDYFMSNENVDDIIRINEYTFSEDGERFG
jgi:hypothetical protein